MEQMAEGSEGHPKKHTRKPDVEKMDPEKKTAGLFSLAGLANIFIAHLADHVPCRQPPTAALLIGRELVIELAGQKRSS
jgi:hypothetical protein